jgi:hypothetical protein
MGGVGMGVQARRTKRQNEQEEKLMGMALGNQKDLNIQGHQLQYEMWKKTNYPGQLKMMKEAGLNPGLMYGQGGGGGTTTGSQSGGSAPQGNSAQEQQVKMQDMLMGMQMKLMDAQARKTNAEAVNEEGGVKDNLQATYEQTMARTEGMKTDNYVNETTKRAQIEKIRKDAVNEGLKKSVMEAGVNLDKKKTEQLQQKIYQDWAKVGFTALDSILGIVTKNLKNVNSLKEVSIP